MAPKTSFNAVAFCRLLNVTKKLSLKLCSVRFWRHFFLAFNSWTGCSWGKKDRIHRSIYILPNESMICPYYVYHSNLPHAMFYFFYNFFILSLSFSVHWVKLWIKPNGNISQRSRDCRSNNWISMKKHNLFVILKYTYIIWNEDTLPASQWAIKWEKMKLCNIIQ